MLGRRDLGFPSPVFLVVVVVVPVIVVILRRKWRQSVARSEEVRRLLVSASEESNKVEFEAREAFYYAATATPSVRVSTPTPVYASVPLSSPVKPPYLCAVCFCPTTTRCAKCKAVRYCSGKCQIVHWRQGHKDECRPYVAVTQINNLGGSSNRQGDNKGHSDTFDTETKQTATPAESKSPLSYEGRSATHTSFTFTAGVTFENLETVKSVHGTSVSPARKSPNLSDEYTPTTKVTPGSVGEAGYGQLANHTTKVVSNANIMGESRAAKVVHGSGLRSEKSNDVTDSSRPPTCTSGMLNHRDGSADSDMPTFKLKNSSSGAPSYRASTAVRYAKVSEKPNGIFCNKSTAPDVSQSKDVLASSTRASDTYLKTVTSRNISHSAKPVKIVDDDSCRITTSSSQLTEASRSGSKTSKLKVLDHLKSSKLSRQESLEGGSDTAQRYSFKGLFPYEMFIKLYNWKQVELQPCGLKNCGNSCYANAVLQCLIYTPPLTAYLLEGLHSKACEKRGWCFTCEFEGLVMKAKGGISPLSPVRILTHIENMGSNLGHGKEEDAHEFLRYVIDALQSVCIKESRRKSLNPLEEEETTLIGLTFGGYLRSKIVCMKCGGKTEQHERMMDLTIEIEGDVRTLKDALDKFTCTEILDGENKYKCIRCKSYERAKKKFSLLDAPNVLTIVLKRFQSGKFGKLNKSIHFPEILDMAPYVSGTSDKSPIYSLYGVVVHIDTMNAAFSGHYVCYVKNLQNRWFKFDDSMVKEVDLQHVLTKGAYMLLYARCSPRAPRSIRSSIIHHHHHDPRKHKIPPSSFVSKSNSIAPWDACGYQPSHVHHRNLEEDSSSSDNSGCFSESCSCSTESTHRDTSSIEDHISGDWEPDYHRNINLNSSDSDTSSSSSFPSPLYSRLSHLYTSTANGEDNHKVCRNLDCSCNSCRITNLDRLGGRATYSTSKPSVTFRRSTTRGKSD